MPLTGPQREKLNQALLSAFPTYGDLERMVAFKLNEGLGAIAGAGNLRDVIFQLARWAEAQGRLADLVVKAREDNPGNALLLEASQEIGLAPAAAPAGPALERIIRQANGTLDVVKWRTRLFEIEQQVCRVEIQSTKGTIYGTGFLLGPDVVMTNYHVAEAAIQGKQAKPADVRLRFDFKRLADGTTLNPGTVYRLKAKDWLIDQSPPSPVDDQPEPKKATPDTNQLDYVLLRTEGKPGTEPAGGKKAGAGAPPRKWVEPPDEEYDFPNRSPLFIVQHPQGDPLQLALDTDAIIGLNANRTRVRYKTNTEAGSSGSPCFNMDWELVALHHSGDPNFDPAHKPAYNEGVPFRAILSLLDERGLKGRLGAS
jgi:hypothetical protein